jgi:hypothetical protein
LLSPPPSEKLPSFFFSSATADRYHSQRAVGFWPNQPPCRTALPAGSSPSLRVVRPCSHVNNNSTSPSMVRPSSRSTPLFHLLVLHPACHQSPALCTAASFSPAARMCVVAEKSPSAPRNLHPPGGAPLGEMKPLSSVLHRR